MNFFELILFYTISSSLILTYGVGLERLFISSKNPKEASIFLVKTFALQSIGIGILWPINQFILIKLNINFLLPTMIIIILFLLRKIPQKILPEKLLSKIMTSNEEEVVFYYAPIFIAILQSSSYMGSIAIIVAANLGLLVLTYVLNAIKEKIDSGNATEYWKKAPLILISIGIILTGFYFIF